MLKCAFATFSCEVAMTRFFNNKSQSEDIMTKVKELAVLLSGLLGFVVPTYFAWTVYQGDIPQNVASWSMILLLDVLGLVLAYRAGNKQPYLQLGWCFAAICIVLAITFGKSPWHWGWVESVSLILAGFAIVLWLTLSAQKALWAYMAATYISYVPLMVDYWEVPQPGTLWLWLWTVGTCLLAIYGAQKRDFANTFVPWGCVLLNITIAWLCIR